MVQPLKDDTAIDAVQLMHNRWCIYVSTHADRTALVNLGITLAGKYIPLKSEFSTQRKSTAKVIIKDLPLHTVNNEDVLEALKEHCEVQLEVLYSNIWHNGCLTNIRNGDCFAYVLQQDLLSIPDHLVIGEYRGCVFKLKAQTICSRCKQVGHHSSDKDSPTHALPEMIDVVQPFHGGKSLLSNLHKCPEGCTLRHDNQVFLSSEHMYQHHKLKAHDVLEADSILAE